MPNPIQVTGDQDPFINEQNEIAAAVTKAQRTLAGHNPFVYCAECGDEIGEARKRVLPSTLHCVKCAAKAER